MNRKDGYVTQKGFNGNFFKLDLNINIKSRQWGGGGDSASPKEAVSESAKWREGGSPGKGWGDGRAHS